MTETEIKTDAPSIKWSQVIPWISLVVSFVALLSIDNSSSDLSPIEDRLDAIETLNAEQTSSIYTNSNWINYLQSKNTSGVFSPSENGFNVINSSYGPLLVSLKNIEKYGNGYKVSFDIGNTTSITISGLKGKVSWRPVVDYQKYYSDAAYIQNIQENTGSKDFSLTDNFSPGYWTRANIIIAPATEENIGEIIISGLSSDQVYMRLK